MTPDHSMPPLPEPKPCPFCGSESECCTIPADHPDAGAMFVQCTNSACMASSALIYPLMDDPKPLLLERWNRRTPDAQPLLERIKELEARLDWIVDNADVFFHKAQWIDLGNGRRVHTTQPSSHELIGCIDAALSTKDKP